MVLGLEFAFWSRAVDGVAAGERRDFTLRRIRKLVAVR